MTDDYMRNAAGELDHAVRDLERDLHEKRGHRDKLFGIVQNLHNIGDSNEAMEKQLSGYDNELRYKEREVRRLKTEASRLRDKARLL